MSVICNRSVVFSGYSGFPHQYNWPPRYNWNIVESGVKHHQPKPKPILVNYVDSASQEIMYSTNIYYYMNIFNMSRKSRIYISMKIRFMFCFWSSLPPVVCTRAHVFTLFVLCAHSGLQHILLCFSFVLFSPSVAYVANLSGLSIFDCPFGDF